MSDLKICRICLRTEAKMYKYDKYQLKYYHEEVMALKMDENDSLPKYYCYECATMLHKFHKFKEKCYIGQKVLKQLLWKGPITYESVYTIDRASTNLQSPLSIMTLTNLVKKYIIQETTKEPVDNINIEPMENYFTDNSISVDQFSVYDEMKDENDEMITKGDKLMNDDEICKREGEDCEEPPSPQTIFVDTKNGVVKLESECINDKKTKSDASRFLNSSHWKTITLTEEEALIEFRSRANSKQYLGAAFKCADCFRGFSQEDMLKRHTLLRHSEGAGALQCRFCRTRFRYKSFLRKHLAHHYERYRCLRCARLCPFRTSAMMHEEYHNGVRLRCVHCDEEFRHRSTYYSHLRTHRSGWVCARCGRAFVSERGLKNHAKVKHLKCHPECSDDEEDADTNCEKCGIQFGSRQAFEEHLFQSALHSAGVGENVNIECSLPKKILGKKEKAKITSELRKRKDDMSPLVSFNTKRKKRQKRNRRKPTTCHQCGQHFATQAACMRHHVAAHPGTSFFPPALRHICEICGASLAPGSVAVHRNIHSRERVHACDACGRQFHSSIGLRRHLVTHTGEKPFGCPLCEKRFTQSNSMKLHYRTFHLKEPYPKRNRRKHKEVQETAAEMDVSHSEPDSDCLPEPPGIEPVTDALDDDIISSEPIQYMPL